jgi:hypothetical protein
MFPSNIMEATFRQAQTAYEKVKPSSVGKNFTLDQMAAIKNGTMYNVKTTIEMKDGINVLGKSIVSQ